MIDVSNTDAVRAEAERRARLRAKGVSTFDAPAVVVDEPEDGALEDVHVAEGVRIMRAFGFTAYNFSQKKRAKVTPGPADWKFYHRARGLAVWWEAKSDTGRQRPAQREFQLDAVACGETYVIGTLDRLIAWLEHVGVAVMVNGTLEPISRG